MPTRTEDKKLVVRDAWPLPGRKGAAQGPNKKQIEFFDACHERDAEEILFAGSIRAGKTQAACKQIVAWAWQYGGTYIVARRTYRELEDSTKKAMLRGDGPMPPALPPELVKEYRATDNMVTLHNGAEILFRSLEEARAAEDKIKNITLAGFLIDQVEELDSPEYFQLYNTMTGRLSDPRGPRRALLVANPAPETHWVYERFVDEFAREPQCRYIHVTLFDNEYHLPESYVGQMKRREKTQPDWYRRFILGEWGAFGGKRFKWWNPQLHVVTPEEVSLSSQWEFVEAIDWGWAHPTAVVWCAITFEGRWYVVAEHYERERPISYHAQKIKETRNALGISPSAVYLDPSAFAAKSQYESTAMEFFDYGIMCAKAQNDRLGGWNRIEEMLGERMEHDGLPRLQVFSRCKNLIKELPNLKLKEQASGLMEDVDKVNDHASDALRYAIMSRMPHPEKTMEEEIYDKRDFFIRRKRRELEERSAGLFTGAW